MRVVLATLVLPLLGTNPVLAQDEAQAVKAFTKAFQPSAKRQPDQAQRHATLEALTQHDTQKVAKALVKVFASVQTEVATLDLEREELSQEMAKIMKGQEYSARPTLPKPVFDRYNEIKALNSDKRRQVDDRRENLSRVGQVISERRDTKAVSWMVKTVSGGKKYPLYLKVKVAQAAGGVGEPVLAEMLAACKKTKVPEEAAALLDGIGLIGEAARPAAATVIEMLQHKQPMVREHAALALSTLCDPNAIEPMIELLASSHGQTKKRIAAALEVLTRQQHGTSAATWRRWFKAEGAEYLAGGAELGGGKPTATKSGNTKNYYFGIPQDGKSIVYVIDSSGSMKAEIELRLPKSEPPAGGGKGGGTVAEMEKKPGDSSDKARKTTRLEACKDELIRALGRLQPTTMFNVIWYSDLPHQFKPTMLKASPKAVGAAQAWVRKLQPNQTTNIHDSMQMAFELTGQLPGLGKQRGPTTGRKQKRASAPDTIFLLSDGSPTLPTGKPDSTEKIITAVRSWNALKSVVVHCIGIGKGINEPFMRRLATENGGEFKRY